MAHRIINADARHIPIADGIVQTCVTSPPYYGLRDYGNSAQIGLEQTPSEYVDSIVQVMREVWRVLRDDGTLFLNLGDSYFSSAQRAKPYDTSDAYHLKPKDLIGIPWRVAFALQDDGWYLRSDIIWHKPNPMPESVTDRPTKSHEYIFLLAKQQRYYYDSAAISEDAIGCVTGGFGKTYDGARKLAMSGGAPSDVKGKSWNERNRRTVWTVATSPFNGAKLMCDYVGADGKPYTASPDCPLHGHLARSRKPYIPSDGGQPEDQQNRTSDTGDYPYQERAYELKSTTSHSHAEGLVDNAHGQSSGNTGENKTSSRQNGHSVGDGSPDHTTNNLESREQSDHKTDSSRLDSSLSAKSHSKQKSKTRRDQQTAQHDNAYAQIPSGILGIEQFGELSQLDRGNSENSIPLGDYSAHPSAQNPYGNMGISSYSGVYCTCRITSIDHFATYPPKLIEPCILAGSKPGDIVLDPFCGAGTTGAVALEHGRDFVGVEINAEYIRLAEERISRVQPRLAA